MIFNRFDGIFCILYFTENETTDIESNRRNLFPSYDAIMWSLPPTSICHECFERNDFDGHDS